MPTSSLLPAIERVFAAYGAPSRWQHERDRACWRIFIAAALSLFLVAEHRIEARPWGSAALGLAWVAGLAAGCSFLYRQYLRARRESGIVPQYTFLLLDPILFLGAMTVEAERLAPWYPLLFLVILSAGICFGSRTLWLSWSCTALAASVALPLSAYWRREWPLALSFAVLLALLPAFFLPLIRRLHAARALEAERARIDALEATLAARSGFLSKVAHELRSPLQSMVSALDVHEVRREQGLHEDPDFVRRMRRSSMLLNTQLSDLLTLVRGEAGRLQVNPELFEACDLVESVARALRDEAKQKGLDLVVDLPTAPIFVIADAARIDQVLTNLVSNSIRYTEAGQVRITLHPAEPGATSLRFSVADTGPGIPKDVLPLLLDPERRDAGTERKGEGSGLGLAVVRMVVQRLGGKVSISSGDESGTVFDIDLQVERVNAELTRRVSLPLG